MIFKKGMTPALESQLFIPNFPNIFFGRRKSYKTAMLIANSAPIFSFLFIATAQTIFHGRIARVMSARPEKTTKMSVHSPP